MNKIKHVIVAAASIAPWIYLAFIYKGLPETVAVHFGADGMPDRMGNKSELLTAIIILTTVSVFTYVLMVNIYRIDPKKNAGANKDKMATIACASSVFLSLVSIGIIQSTIIGKAEFISRLLIPAIGLFFAIIGNYLTNIKPNYFMGLRLPWTLESEENWRKTHQLAGKWWFWGGLAITVCTVFLRNIPQLIVFGIITMVIVVVPVIYSYQQYKLEQQNK